MPLFETLSSVCNVSIAGNAVNVDSHESSSIFTNAASNQQPAKKPAPKPVKPAPAPSTFTDCGIVQWPCPKGTKGCTKSTVVVYGKRDNSLACVGAHQSGGIAPRWYHLI